MTAQQPDLLRKLKWSFPWLVRYPLWRARQLIFADGPRDDFTHIVFVVADHFEPEGGREALRRVERGCRLARSTGNAVRDHDGTPFRHTYFFPAEQYDAEA